MRRLIGLFAALGIVGCGSATGPLPRSSAAFEGPVVEIWDGRGGGTPSARRVLVQAEPPDRWSGRIWVEVTPATYLIDVEGSPVQFEDLGVSDVVRVWVEHILESDPAQAEADTLMVVGS